MNKMNKTIKVIGIIIVIVVSFLMGFNSGMQSGTTKVPHESITAVSPTPTPTATRTLVDYQIGNSGEKNIIINDANTVLVSGSWLNIKILNIDVKSITVSGIGNNIVYDIKAHPTILDTNRVSENSIVAYDNPAAVVQK